MRLAIFIVAAVPLLIAETPIAIEGTAFNRVTNAGVSGVSVKIALSSEPYRPVYSTKTDASGSFRIEGVKEGDYTPIYEAPHGFEAPPSYTTTPFHVGTRNNPAHLSISMMPLATIRGRVLAPDGNPVPRVQVELVRVHFPSGKLMTTDEAGVFFVGNINPGKYRLRARPALPGSPLAERMKTVSGLPKVPPEGERWTWAPTYFPSSLDLESAQFVSVREGAELVGYDIHLRSAPVYRVRGFVRDPYGIGVSGVELKLLTDFGWGASEARVRSGEGGTFEFPSVRSGTWLLVAEVQRGHVKWSGNTKISVPKRDVDVGQIQVGPPFNLSGLVERDVPDNREESRLFVRLIPRDGSPFDSPRASERNDGQLVFENVYAGKYRIVSSMRYVQEYYLKSILFGPDEVLGREVDIAPGAPPIRVVMNSKAALITGTVEKGANAIVVLVEPDRDRETADDMMRLAVCNSQGRFTLRGVRPATYLVIVPGITGNLETGRVLEGLFDYGLIQKAQRVKVGEGEIKNLQLTVTPWPD